MISSILQAVVLVVVCTLLVAGSAKGEDTKVNEDANLAEVAFRILKNNDAEALSRIILTREHEEALRQQSKTKQDDNLAERSAENTKKSLEAVRKLTKQIEFDWAEAKLVRAMLTEDEPYDPDFKTDKSFEIFLFIESQGRQLIIEVDDCVHVDGVHRVVDGFRPVRIPK